MFLSFQSFVTTPLIREKIYKGIFTGMLSSRFNNLNVTEIKLMFLLSNNLSNKSLFFALLLILEKIALGTFSFVFTKKSIANFNIKKQLKLGAIYTLTNESKDQFLRTFVAYSLKKIDTNLIFYSSNSISYSFTKNNLAFGLQKILFNFLFSINHKDYELFAPFFENMVYGVHIYFYTHFRNFFLNRLILSQYNLILN
jgi:ribosomal protein L5